MFDCVLYLISIWEATFPSNDHQLSSRWFCVTCRCWV